MTKFKFTTLAAAILGFSLCASGAAFAVIPGQAPSGPVVTDDDAAGTVSDVYAQSHKAALGAFTQLKTIVTSDKVAPTLKQLATEMAGLPALEKAYLDAKAAGKDAEAKTALDAYVKSAQTIVSLALPLEPLAQMQARFEAGFDAMGPDGAKLKGEADIAALLKDVDAALKPLSDANEVIGPLHDAANQAAQVRIQKEAERIFTEELAKQVETALNAKLPATK